MHLLDFQMPKPVLLTTLARPGADRYNAHLLLSRPAHVPLLLCLHVPDAFRDTDLGARLPGKAL